MNGDPNGNSDSNNGLKRKYDSVESIEDAPGESKTIKDKICGICIENITKEDDASKACPHSDKHDFHKKCITTYLDL